VFYREGLLATRPIPKLEDHPSAAVRDCLLNLFTATHFIGGRYSIRNLRTRHAVVTGTYVIKSRRMRCAGHMARMGEEREVYRALVGNPDGKRPMGRTRRRWVE